MKNCKLNSIIIIYMLFALAFVSPLQSESLQKKEKNPTGLRVVLIKGSPYQRGLIHGKTLKNEIKTTIHKWKEEMKKKKSLQGKDLDELITGFMKKTRFYEAARRWTPNIIDEVKGIAEGSGIDLDTIMLFQVSEEFETFGRYILSIVGRCTSIGVRGGENQAAFVAQNMDIPDFLHSFPTLLHVVDEASGIESYVYTIPGLVGLCGLNNKAIAITCNALTQLQFTGDGLPVAFIVRGVLAQKDYDDASRFLKEITHATGQNYIIGGPRNVESFECSVNQVMKYQPEKLKHLVFHTNHPIVNKNYFPRFLRALKKRNITLEDYDSRCKRFNSLSRTFKEGDRPVSLEFIKTLLSPRAEYINNDYTYGTLIMKLTPQPELHLSPGRPDETVFRVFRFQSMETGK
ncbi:MAG: hypothetical protein JSV88_31470 [Candidatus Aminicenantes bacterium]|nr:MAG: hypothetical protein JSV88_31470 [Candidatus Aminicenantes bacterium]